MNDKKKQEAPKKRRKWRRSMLLRKGWALVCLFVLLTMLVSMTIKGY